MSSKKAFLCSSCREMVAWNTMKMMMITLGLTPLLTERQPEHHHYHHPELHTAQYCAGRLGFCAHCWLVRLTALHFYAVWICRQKSLPREDNKNWMNSRGSGFAESDFHLENGLMDRVTLPHIVAICTKIILSDDFNSNVSLWISLWVFYLKDFFS